LKLRLKSPPVEKASSKFESTNSAPAPVPLNSVK